jgi:hypothetical protein
MSIIFVSEDSRGIVPSGDSKTGFFFSEGMRMEEKVLRESFGNGGEIISPASRRIKCITTTLYKHIRL